MDYNDALNVVRRAATMTRIRYATPSLGTLKGAITQYVSRRIQLNLTGTDKFRLDKPYV